MPHHCDAPPPLVFSRSRFGNVGYSKASTTRLAARDARLFLQDRQLAEVLRDARRREVASRLSWCPERRCFLYRIPASRRLAATRAGGLL
jgi:hypothetical protein